MDALKTQAAWALGVAETEIHTTLVVEDELVVLLNSFAKYRLPLATLPQIQPSVAAASAVGHDSVAASIGVGVASVYSNARTVSAAAENEPGGNEVAEATGRDEVTDEPADGAEATRPAAGRKPR